MTQYVIIAKDGTDALERRMEARPQHLAGARALKEANNYVVGGAILNESGQMSGSVMIVQFETEAELEAWRSSEPYINGRVWESIEVHPFRIANV